MIHNVEYKVHIQHIIQLKIQNSGDEFPQPHPQMTLFLVCTPYTLLSELCPMHPPPHPRGP